MKAVAFLTLAGLLTVQASAADKITVADLEQIVAAAHNQPDKAAAKHIGSLMLGERVSDARFEKMNAELPGPESQTALQALADAAAFLDLPAADVPATLPPSIDEQRSIVVRAVQFAADNIHQMPDLRATRKTTQYQNVEPPPKNWLKNKTPRNADKSLIEIAGPFTQLGKSQATVVYRNGHEVVESQPKKEQSRSYGVTNRGEFGEMLRLVMTDMVQAQIRWSHWEASSTGTVAVFDFDVPIERAQYRWAFCCKLTRDRTLQPVIAPATYHAQIAIDPDNGAVLRLVVKTEPNNQMVMKAQEIVEYGPVEIASRVYMCPIKNVVLYVVLDYGANGPDPWSAPDDRARLRVENDPLISIALNHASFENYHVFRSEVQIHSDTFQELPAQGTAPATNPDPHAQQP